jgi:hypothetical protein
MNSNRCHNEPQKLIWHAFYCVGPTHAKISRYYFARTLHSIALLPQKLSTKILLVWLFTHFARFAPTKTLG